MATTAAATTAADTRAQVLESAIARLRRAADAITTSTVPDVSQQDRDRADAVVQSASFDVEQVVQSLAQLRASSPDAPPPPAPPAPLEERVARAIRPALGDLAAYADAAVRSELAKTVDQIVDDLRPLTGGGRVEDSTLRTKLDAIAKDASISSDLEDVLNAVAESLVARSTLLYGRLVAAAGDALAEALLPNVDTGTAKMDGEEDNEQATPVATADTFPADALLPNVDTAMAEMGGEEEASPPQWSEPNLYALSKIPDPTNTTIAQLRPLIDAKVALAGKVDESWRSLIAEFVLCCFFKHAMRFFNQSEHTMTRAYNEVWSDESMTHQQQRTEALGDELVTLFRSGTVLYFDRLGEATGCYKVTFLRDVECYVTGRGLLVEIMLNEQTANYSVESMDGKPEAYSSEHNCVLLYDGTEIAALDYCWDPASALAFCMRLSEAVGVTRGSLEKTVREKFVECNEDWYRI